MSFFNFFNYFNFWGGKLFFKIYGFYKMFIEFYGLLYVGFVVLIFL